MNLEAEDAGLRGLKGGAVIGSPGLPSEDREAALTLIEPAGVDRQTVITGGVMLNLE